MLKSIGVEITFLNVILEKQNERADSPFLRKYHDIALSMSRSLCSLMGTAAKGSVKEL